jgi:hypothetical protein
LDLERKSKVEMNPVVTDQVTLFLALIEQTGIWALRVGFTLAVVIIVLAGVFIWLRREQFFDRDPNVENDIPVVRNNREEEILFVWSGLMLVLLSIFYQVWSACGKHFKFKKQIQKRWEI